MENVPITQQKAFLTALLYVATLDSHYHPTEQTFVQQALNASQLGEQERADVLKTLEVRPKIEEVLSQITDAHIARQLVQQLVLLAHVDDEYAAAERDGVRWIANFFGLSEGWVEATERWAADGMAWRRKGQELLSQ